MFTILEKTIAFMALLRILSGCIEVFAAYLMIRFNDIEKALIINSSLALIGPLILILTTTIGIFGIADKLSFSKVFWIALGVGCILYGVKHNG
ncbi:YqhV family protein [Virgibacillus sp. 179-BFC.A HS]|uniref:YqhV family protein n=1 Tax=Tigheibacillus jepli TaxID=3035914 RepID=A0ABU5CJL9_9BACI|nr:YqhV family protein [Virgibacillus sp. 179-BFC.A HS]MDY0406558.1 YqhV family protein [Virgibacillus sp. 179-BFC.A HS]